MIGTIFGLLSKVLFLLLVKTSHSGVWLLMQFLDYSVSKHVTMVFNCHGIGGCFHFFIASGVLVVLRCHFWRYLLSFYFW